MLIITHDVLRHKVVKFFFHICQNIQHFGDEDSHFCPTCHQTHERFQSVLTRAVWKEVWFRPLSLRKNDRVDVVPTKER